VMLGASGNGKVSSKIQSLDKAKIIPVMLLDEANFYYSLI
jgi:hypothetical protein